MDDFDDIKNLWKNQNIEPKYDDSEILEILNRKSTNYAWFFFLIGFAEFIIMAVISCYYFIFGDEAGTFLHILGKIGVKYSKENIVSVHILFLTMRILGLILTAVFALKFYLVYKKINTEENIKTFVTRLLQVKKTVKNFILLNILIILISICIFGWYALDLASEQNIHLDQKTRTGIFTGIAVAVSVGAILFWIYYKIVYGIIMKKLTDTLNQIKKIESLD